MEQILFNHSQKPTSRPPSHRRGFLNLGFELNGQGRSIMRHWERRAPLIVQQELYFDREMPLLPCVYILSSGGPILSSDSFEQHFSLKRGAMAHISTGAATKVAEMNGGSAQMRTYIRLEDEAYLEYLPQPTIPCRGSRFLNHTHITISPSATLLWAEIYFSGRKFHGESFEFGELELQSRATGIDEKLLFSERMIISPHTLSPQSVGIMGRYDIWASVVVLTPQNLADEIYHLSQNHFSQQLMSGVGRLPNACGLQLKVLGVSSIDVKDEVRRFCSLVRLCVKGKPLPEEFRWR